MKNITQPIPEQHYQPLFESGQVGVLMLDAVTYKITDVNPFLMELLECSRDEFVGRELQEMECFRDVAPGSEAFQQLRETGSISSENLGIVTKGGNRYFVDFVASL